MGNQMGYVGKVVAELSEKLSCKSADVMPQLKILSGWLMCKTVM